MRLRVDMVSDSRTEIAAMSDAHAALGFDPDFGPNDQWVCYCGVTWRVGGTHGEHVADLLIRELGLKHYCRECGGYGPFDE